MIDSTRKLAYLGGEPYFSSPLHVNRPSLGSKTELLEKFSKVLDSNFFTNDGPCVQELEARLAEKLKVNHCIAMANGTMAMYCVIKALKLKGEVIMPSFSFVSTAHLLKSIGVKTVFCDIDAKSFNLDPGACERLITNKTSAIIPTHLFGRNCNIEAFEELSQRFDVNIVYDAAHAFNCNQSGKPIASFGKAEIFSFHATKAFHTMEGGAVTTNDSKLAGELRILKNFGFTNYDQVEQIGFNAKMNEVSAATGLINLDHFDEIVSKNRTIYLHYQKRLSQLPGIRLIDYDEGANYHYVVALINQNLLGISRDRLMDCLHAENILARRYFYPGIHKMKPYTQRIPVHLPNTESISKDIIQLPAGANISLSEVSAICDIIEEIIKRT